MTDAEKHEMLTEARLFYLAAPLLQPMLDKREKIVINNLVMRHRDGSGKFDTLVAELAVIEGLKIEIDQKYKTYQTLEEKK